MIVVELDPEEAGFDPQRLARIDRHFQRYVDDRKLPGYLFALAYEGQIVHVAKGGMADIEAGKPVAEDTLWRIYSMTKPITSVAVMMLWEEGFFELKDPVSKFIPSFADVRVWRGGSPLNPATAPATEPVRIWHLLTHTSGLTYGFHHAHPVDEMYRAAGFEWGSPAGMDLEGCVDAWASLPLVFEPGSEWNYSHATDVLGRLVEVVSGHVARRVPAGAHLRAAGDDRDRLHGDRHRPARRALQPWPRPQPGDGQRGGRRARLSERRRRAGEQRGRLPELHARHPRRRRAAARQPHDGLHEPRTTCRAAPSSRRSRAASARSARRSSPATASGSGFSVVEDPIEAKMMASPGELAWGGAASTSFWVDPLERITAVFFTQLLPSSTYPLRPQLRQLVYQALR